MRRKVFSIWAVLLILLISIAVLSSGCVTQQPDECTIIVEATLCDAPWEGAVQYKLMGPGITSPIIGTEVPSRFTVDFGRWTCYDIIWGPTEGGNPEGDYGDATYLNTPLEDTEDIQLELGKETDERIVIFPEDASPHPQVYVGSPSDDLEDVEPEPHNGTNGETDEWIITFRIAFKLVQGC